MTDPLTQVGIGGALAILVIGEVLNFLKARNGKSSGEKQPEYWREAFRQIVADELKAGHEERVEILRTLQRLTDLIQNLRRK